MSVFPAVLILATFLCLLVAGFLFAFAVVVMPGIRALNARDFIRAFQVMDRVIQNNQPIFVLVWAGSAVALLLAAVIGFGQLDATGRLLIVAAALIYVLGVQLPTMIVNVPLNNRLQALDLDTMDESAQEAARTDFESRWNQWNSIRTVVACLASLLLLVLLFRL